jgi:hypothetical protein
MGLDPAPVAATKQCPFCVELIQAAALVCRYCRRDLPVELAHQVALTASVGAALQTCPFCQESIRSREVLAAITSPRALPRRLTRRTLGIAMLCLIGAVVLYAELSFARPASLSSATLPLDATRAWADCTRFIKKNIEASSSPQFPAIENPEVSITPLATGQWLVHGYVDAQNDVGARVRQHFLCQMTYNRAKMTLQQLSIGDHETLND